MGDNLRREVLRVFKKLHRTRLRTFKGDDYALQAARQKINEEYKKYKDVTNPAAIEELNRFAEEVEQEVRTTVVQAVKTEKGTFLLNITPDTAMWDNVPYKDMVESYSNKTKSERCCLKDSSQNSNEENTEQTCKAQPVKPNDKK